MAMDPAYIALIGTLCGGIGLKVAEHYLGKGGKRNDDAARIRDELRIEITTLREDRRLLEERMDELQAKYLALYEKYITTTTELARALQKIGDDALQATKNAEHKLETQSPPEK